MTVVQAVVLGIVQGITEFLPVSSSGHLVFVPWLLGWDTPSVTFDVFLHLGTAVAVVTYFRKDLAKITRGFWGSLTGSGLKDPHGRLAWLVLAGIAPVLLAGAVFKTFFESLFESPLVAAGGLVFTAVALISAEARAARTNGDRHLVELQAPDAVAIGLLQVAAIVPGVSRAGMTIAAGTARGLRRRAAARFSFLMFVPLVAATTAAKAIDVLRGDIPSETVLVTSAGFLTSMVTGYLAIAVLLRFLQKGRLTVFAVYCMAAAAAIAAVASFR